MKQFVRTAFATTLVAAPMLSLAAGNITFKGKVLDQTCSVQIEGTDSPTVTLPTVSTKQLDHNGASAGITPFKVKVSGCKGGTGTMAINTVFSGAPITAEGNLKNTHSTPAANVEVQLLKDTTGNQASVIKLTSVTSVSGLELAAGAQEAEYEFAARYYAVGAATAGDVQAVVNYDITYN